MQNKEALTLKTVGKIAGWVGLVFFFWRSLDGNYIHCRVAHFLKPEVASRSKR